MMLPISPEIMKSTEAQTLELQMSAALEKQEGSVHGGKPVSWEHGIMGSAKVQLFGPILHGHFIPEAPPHRSIICQEPNDSERSRFLEREGFGRPGSLGATPRFTPSENNAKCYSDHVLDRSSILWIPSNIPPMNQHRFTTKSLNPSKNRDIS